MATKQPRTHDPKYRKVRSRLVREAYHNGLTHCPVCHQPIDWQAWLDGRRTPRSPEVDHVWPVSLGGPNTEREWMRVICGDCNRKLGNRVHLDSTVHAAAKPRTLTTDIDW